MHETQIRITPYQDFMFILSVFVRGAMRSEKREPIEQVLATVDVLTEGQWGQGERGNFSNLVSQPYAFEVLRLT